MLLQFMDHLYTRLTSRILIFLVKTFFCYTNVTNTGLVNFNKPIIHSVICHFHATAVPTYPVFHFELRSEMNSLFVPNRSFYMIIFFFLSFDLLFLKK